MDIVNVINNHSNEAVERRESVDSGISLSPTPPASVEPSRRRNKKKKRLFSTVSASTFADLYSLKGDVLGQGSYGRVETCINKYTQQEYAVKIVNKDSWAFNRQKMLKEIELYYLCQGNDAVIQLIEYFEESDKFFLIFEKAKGGHLLNQVNKRKMFSEKDAAIIMAKLAKALTFLHSRGIAHRDLKPENILCMSEDFEDVAASIRLCDFDLCSQVNPTVTTPMMNSPVGSPEYLAPEVVEVFLNEENIMYDLLEEDDEVSYDKRCDLWSLGVICYTLICGLLPFRGCCGEDCGWEDRNEECNLCQADLYNNIKKGHVVFPEHVSPMAKDLISKLLQIDADQRMEAADVLCHPWIARQTEEEEDEEEHNSSSAEDELLDEVFLPVLASVPVSPATLRKAMSVNNYWLPKSQEKPGAKFRRQSSVVTSFCHPPEDLICRGEL